MAQVFVLNRARRRENLAGSALEGAPLLLLVIRLLIRLRRALLTNGFRVDAKLYERDHGLTEQRVQAKEQLAAHGFELLLPGRVGDGDDQRFSVESKRHGLPAQARARDAPPGDHGGGFGNLFRLASRAQQFGQCANQIFHGEFSILDLRFAVENLKLKSLKSAILNLKSIGSVMEEERGPQAPGGRLGLKEVFEEQLVLASASPRRAEILRAVGWPFEAFPVNIDESPRQSETAVEMVERLAREKAQAAARRLPSRLVLGADTVVVLGGDVMLGKPRDEQDARRMLRLLSGRWHEVLTGVALVGGGEQAALAVAHEATRVRFCAMSDEEINWYVATGEPLDKDGAYAVQGRAALFIEEIRGDYWNVVGLPVRLVYKLARGLYE